MALLLMAPRLYLAMSRDGVFPAALELPPPPTPSAVSTRNANAHVTPAIAIGISGRRRLDGLPVTA
jgi:hypothetical protein